MYNKRCCRCKITKTPQEFHNNKSISDGLSPTCKSCKIKENIRDRKKNTERTLKWKENNPEKWKKNLKNATAKSRKKPITKLRNNIRKTLSKLLKNKSNRFSPTISCTGKELSLYLENLFTSEMTWENKNEVWELDHTIPLAAFDLSNPIERRYANHYLNLRPCLKMENYTKWAHYKEEDKLSLIAKIESL